MDVTADIATRNCKEYACEEEAVDARGRYAGLCRAHKAQKTRAMGEERRGTTLARRERGAIVEAADELRSQARRVDRASKRLDEERAELRRVYLRFGVEAGFLNPR